MYVVCISISGYLTTYTSLSPIWRGFAPGFVIYKKGCTQLAAASDKVYQLLVHGQWFSPGTPASSTTKTYRHDLAEVLLKVALNTINQSMNQFQQLTKNPEDYPDKKSLPHVQVAMRFNSKGGKKMKGGDTVAYVVCEVNISFPNGSSNL